MLRIVTKTKMNKVCCMYIERPLTLCKQFVFTLFNIIKNNEYF